MKKQIMILALATGIVTNGFGQQIDAVTLTGNPPNTSIPNISLIEVQGKLLTQNSIPNAVGSQRTGSFTTDARWNSMGNLSLTTGTLQTLNGFRTQTDGRALVWGHSIPNNGTVSNSFIQWGGNGNVSPGSLEFRSFTDPSGSGGNPPTPPIHRFSIRENGTSFFGLTPPATSIANPWVEIVNDNPNGNGFPIGLAVSVNNAQFCKGVEIISTALPATPPFFISSSSGLSAEANGIIAFGVIGNANTFTTPGVFDCGILGGSSGGSNSFGGYFDGNVFATGLYLGSDERIKKNIIKSESILKKVVELNAVTYDFDRENVKYLKLPEGKQNGFIAQELEKLFPELVKNINRPIDLKKIDGKMVSYKSVNYIALIPILTKAIQELNNKVDSLSNLLNGKQSQTFVVKENNTAISEQILNETAYSLSQNVPNPFTSNTVIKYTIPATASNASIAILNLNGTMLQQFNGLKGSGNITINGNTLQAGIYLYSLISNGQEIITKRMVLTK